MCPWFQGDLKRWIRVYRLFLVRCLHCLETICKAKCCMPFSQPCEVKKNPLSSSLITGPFGWGYRFPAAWQLSFCLFTNSAAFKQGSTVPEHPIRPLRRPLQSRGSVSIPCHAERCLLEHQSNAEGCHGPRPFLNYIPDHSAD